MSHRTFFLALHCSTSVSSRSLVTLLKWLSIAVQMTNRFASFMILSSSSLYSILQSFPYQNQEWRVFNKLDLNYSGDIYLLASFLFCRVDLGLLVSIGKLSTQSSGIKPGRSGLLFCQHMKKHRGNISFSLSCTLKQDFNNRLWFRVGLFFFSCLLVEIYTVNKIQASPRRGFLSFMP